MEIVTESAVGLTLFLGSKITADGDCNHEIKRHLLLGSNEHESEQALGIGDGQGSLACCSPWGYKESDTTERLNLIHLRLM